MPKNNTKISEEVYVPSRPMPQGELPTVSQLPPPPAPKQNAEQRELPRVTKLPPPTPPSKNK